MEAQRASNTSFAGRSRIFKIECELLVSLCENIDTPRSLSVYLLSRYGEWEQLLLLECKPSNYDDPQLFADDYLVTSVMQKNPRLPTSIDKKRVAIDKFARSEEQCRETNQRLSRHLHGNIPLPSDIAPAIHHAREIIRGMLGPLTGSDLRYAEDSMRFGPGATTSLSGVVTQGKKYSRLEVDATPRVTDFRTFCFPVAWKEVVQSIRVVQSSKLVTVPKNAKTDRVICIEPDLNIFIQLGLGALLRKKLLHSGLDLSTQEVNQQLAKHAEELDLCTMDLSSASDTISREAVWCLLPDDWCHLLHFPRVDSTQVDGKVIPLEKWSSMGNGYTFELETLIFYGVLLGCCKALEVNPVCVTVYGDDLIFPNEISDVVRRTLNFLGFSVNHEKTFGKGRFHESCGSDWFDKVNVRPFFLRSQFHDFESICYLYANNARRWASRNGTCDKRILPFWLRCFTAVKKEHRHKIPLGFGDVGFVSDFDDAKPSLRRSLQDRGWGGFTFRYRSVMARKKEVSQLGCLLAFLNGNISEGTRGIESLRGFFLRAATRIGHTLVWPNLGPWQ